MKFFGKACLAGCMRDASGIYEQPVNRQSKQLGGSTTAAAHQCKWLTPVDTLLQGQQTTLPERTLVSKAE